MRMGKKVFIIGMTLLCLTGCVSQANLEPVTTRNSELTHGNVKLNLEVGVTTQAEVLDVFGAPNITTMDSQGQEVWTYQRAASASQSVSNHNSWTIILGAVGGSVGGIGGVGGGSTAVGSESTSRMITLIIKFDKNDLVSDFRSRASNF